MDFSVTYFFRPHHGPGVDSAPSENEYQEYFLGVKAAGVWGWRPYHLHVPNVRKSGSLKLLELSGPHWACYGTALTLPLYLWMCPWMVLIIFGWGVGVDVHWHIRWQLFFFSLSSVVNMPKICFKVWRHSCSCWPLNNDVFLRHSIFITENTRKTTCFGSTQPS